MPAAAELLSPELVLVDAELAGDRRVPLPAPPDASSSLWEPAPYRERPPESDSAEADEDAIGEARTRLVEAGIASDVLGSLVRARKGFRRRATLIPASAAATSVALLVLQLYLEHGRL